MRAALERQIMIDRSSAKINNVHIKRVTYCNAHVTTIQKWSRHACLPLLKLESGYTILKYIPKNKHGRREKHGVSLCRGRSRAVTFLKTSNHALETKQSLHTIHCLFFFDIPEFCFQSKPHAYFKRDIRWFALSKTTASRRPACFDCQGTARNRPWLDLMQFQCFDPVGIDSSCDFAYPHFYFWTTKSVSTSLAPPYMARIDVQEHA